MTKYRKRSRRKHRREERLKLKNCPADVHVAKNYGLTPVDLEEEIKDLMRAPGAVMWFVNEKGEAETKIKIEA